MPFVQFAFLFLASSTAWSNDAPTELYQQGDSLIYSLEMYQTRDEPKEELRVNSFTGKIILAVKDRTEESMLLQADQLLDTIGDDEPPWNNTLQHFVVLSHIQNSGIFPYVQRYRPQPILHFGDEELTLPENDTLDFILDDFEDSLDHQVEYSDLSIVAGNNSASESSTLSMALKTEIAHLKAEFSETGRIEWPWYGIKFLPLLFLDESVEDNYSMTTDMEFFTTVAWSVEPSEAEVVLHYTHFDSTAHMSKLTCELDFDLYEKRKATQDLFVEALRKEAKKRGRRLTPSMVQKAIGGMQFEERWTVEITFDRATRVMHTMVLLRTFKYNYFENEKPIVETHTTTLTLSP